MWWDANAGVSVQGTIFLWYGLTCSERCSLADLDCMFQGSAGVIHVPVRNCFPSPDALFPLSLAYHKHPRTCVYLLLLSPSSSRTRILSAPVPATSAAKFVILSWGTVIGKGREGFFFFLIGNAFPLAQA